MRARGLSLGRVLMPVAVAGYPFAFYYALTHFGARGAACVALFGALLFALRAVRAKGGASRLELLKLPLVIALLSLLSGLSNEGRFLLALPVIINLLLLYVFGSSLKAPMTYVERIARLKDRDFTDAKVRHCRQVTWVWMVFFVLNAGVTAGLAIWGSVKAWTFHTSILSYVLMGVLFTAEWVVRKIRFGETHAPETVP
jgi:uncharacterized membrane protein